MQQKETISAIAERYYGTNSVITTHCLWYANPNIRNYDSIDADQNLIIPVLPDQSLRFVAGEIVHVYPTTLSNPAYGFDSVVEGDGSATFPFGIVIRVTGLTPRQLTEALDKAYVPRFYPAWRFAVMRVQQPGKANERQLKATARATADASTNSVARHYDSVAISVKGTGFAAYDAALLAAVEQRWFDLLDNVSFDGYRRGKVVLQFHLNYDGRITDMRVPYGDVGDMLSLLCQKAVQDPSPYEKWPVEMRRQIGADFLTNSITFYYK